MNTGKCGVCGRKTEKGFLFCQKCVQNKEQTFEKRLMFVARREVKKFRKFEKQSLQKAEENRMVESWD